MSRLIMSWSRQVVHLRRRGAVLPHESHRMPREFCLALKEPQKVPWMFEKEQATSRYRGDAARRQAEEILRRQCPAA